MIEVRPTLRRYLFAGLIGGILGGLIFAAVETLVSALMGFPFFTPIRAISSIALGPQALSPEYPLDAILGMGTLLHLVLSAVYGTVFAALLWYTGQAGNLSSLAIAMGVLYSLALWAVNFLVVAPMVFDQLVADSSFWLSFTAAHFFYGVVLGAYMLAIDPKKRTIPRSR